ncbi:hypothetical protein C8A05DRAFT_16974, partial [Staphylotrichum tortipilum]
PKRIPVHPSWKAHPDRHRWCFTKILSRVRDVKQHLTRVHKPPLYFTRCSAMFPGAGALQQYVSHPNGLFCTSSMDLNRISDLQQRQISRKSNRNLSKEDQWFALWDIVFARRPWPASAYRPIGISEELASAREYCAAHGWAVLEEAARKVVAAERWPGFAALSAEERQSVLRRCVGKGYERVFCGWFSAVAEAARQNGNGSGGGGGGADGEGLATPPLSSLPDGGGAAEPQLQLPASDAQLEAISGEGHSRSAPLACETQDAAKLQRPQNCRRPRVPSMAQTVISRMKRPLMMETRSYCI